MKKRSWKRKLFTFFLVLVCLAILVFYVAFVIEEFKADETNTKKGVFYLLNAVIFFLVTIELISFSIRNGRFERKIERWNRDKDQ